MRQLRLPNIWSRSLITAAVLSLSALVSASPQQSALGDDSDGVLNELDPTELLIADQLAELAVESSDDRALNTFLRLTEARAEAQGSQSTNTTSGPDADWLVSELLGIRAAYEPALNDHGVTLPPLIIGDGPGDPLPPTIPQQGDDGTIQFSMEACMGAIAAADAAVVGYYAACRGFRRLTPTCAAAGAAALGVMGAAVLTCEIWFREVYATE